MSDALGYLLIVQLLVLAAHDTIPLGRLNNLRQFRAAVPVRRRVIGSLVNSATGVLALVLYYRGRTDGSGVPLGLIVLQGLLFAGELRSWWWPYFTGASTEVAGHLRPNWEGTIAFLPERNSIRINAIHCIMHGVTLAALALAIAGHSR